MLKTIKLSEIKTPKTKEEFQTNLEKYFFPYGTNCLYVKPENGNADGIPYSEISSFNDIYDQTESGFRGDGTSPCIIPLVEFEWGTELSETKLYDQTSKSKHSDLFDLPNLQWTSLDNGMMRDLYAKVLGEFSGYLTPTLEETQ